MTCRHAILTLLLCSLLAGCCGSLPASRGYDHGGMVLTIDAEGRFREIPDAADRAWKWEIVLPDHKRNR